LIDGATPTLTIGDAGAEDTKIVFDGNAQDFYIGLDDSADDLVFGKGSALGTTQAMAIDENMDVAFGPTTNVTITNDGNEDTLTLVSTAANASAGPAINMYRNSSSPADNDFLANVRFVGRNDNSEDVQYAEQEVYILDASDGTEDGLYNVNVMTAGTNTSYMQLKAGTGTVFNEDSNDIDFRVESNGNANMLFVDGGNDVVNIGAATVETGDQFSIHGSGTNTTMRMYNTNAGSDGGLLIFQKNSSSPADGDILGDIRFHGNDDGGGMTQFARIKGESTDVSNGTEDGKMRFEILKAGTTREFLHLGPSNIVFNDDSQDIDLRIESDDTTHMVFFDAENNSFNIDDEGTAGVRSTINKNSSGARVVSTGSYNNVLKIKNGNTANTIDRDATIQFAVGGADEGYMSWVHSDGTNANNHGRFEFAGRNGGTRSLMATFNANNSIVFNEGSLTGLDFRIESGANTHAFFVDAGGEFCNFFISTGASTGSASDVGFSAFSSGQVVIQSDDSAGSGPALFLGRIGHDDGDQIQRFGTNGTGDRGNITISGGTVSYNAFMASHVTQEVPSDTLEGTVLEGTGDLLDSSIEDYVGFVEQKRLTKCKVSNTEDSPNVYGVFQVEAKSGVQYASALGAYFVRVSSSANPSLGDLLSSKGDGTAKVQDDDIIRSKTIGKVTSLQKKTTYSDGSYLLPCVLYCG
jgi:hypothetical protein